MAQALQHLAAARKMSEASCADLQLTANENPYAQRSHSCSCGRNTTDRPRCDLNLTTRNRCLPTTNTLNPTSSNLALVQPWTSASVPSQ